MFTEKAIGFLAALTCEVACFIAKFLALGSLTCCATLIGFLVDGGAIEGIFGILGGAIDGTRREGIKLAFSRSLSSLILLASTSMFLFYQATEEIPLRLVTVIV